MPSVRRLEDVLNEGHTRVSSHTLGESLGITDTQIRKDLASLGSLGQPGKDAILDQIVNWYKELPADSRISMYATAQKLFESRRAHVPAPIRGATKIDHRGQRHVDNKNKRASDKKYG